MNNRRTGLGRGLDALIRSSNTPPASVGQPNSSQEVDIDLIVPNPQQPRTVFDAAALTELADSIREHGVIQPLIVTALSGDAAGTYQLIAGERRLLASRQAGLQRVPVVIKEASPQGLLELALVENLQRADLGPLEEATAFKRLAEDFGLTQELLAMRVGRSRSAVANSLRLLSLPAEIQASIARGDITAGHARALLAIEDQSEQRRVWQQIIEGALSVREAEALVKKGPPSESETAPTRSQTPEVAALVEQFRSLLGTKVDLKKGRKGGQLTIYFYSDEELGSLMQRLSPPGE